MATGMYDSLGLPPIQSSRRPEHYQSNRAFGEHQFTFLVDLDKYGERSCRVMLVNEHVFGIHDSKASCGAGMKHLHGQRRWARRSGKKPPLPNRSRRF